MFPIVLKCCSMVIKASNAPIAGGALDPDQSAAIFDPSIDCSLLQIALPLARPKRLEKPGVAGVKSHWDLPFVISGL
jgi:hypothetical protein